MAMGWSFLKRNPFWQVHPAAGHRSQRSVKDVRLHEHDHGVLVYDISLSTCCSNLGLGLFSLGILSVGLDFWTGEIRSDLQALYCRRLCFDNHNVFAKGRASMTNWYHRLPHVPSHPPHVRCYRVLCVEHIQCSLCANSIKHKPERVPSTWNVHRKTW